MEVDDLKYSPPGWYKVFIVKQDGLLGTSSSSFDICSLDCLAVWAGEREAALNGTRTPIPAIEPAKNGKRHPHGSIKAGMENRELILKAIQESDHPLNTRELVEIIEIKQSSVDRHINILVQEGKILVTPSLGHREGRTYLPVVGGEDSFA
jgi:hypothetical protein